MSVPGGRTRIEDRAVGSNSGSSLPGNASLGQRRQLVGPEAVGHRAGRIHDRRHARPRPGSRSRCAREAAGCRVRGRRPRGERAERSEHDAHRSRRSPSRASITLISTCSSSLTADCERRAAPPPRARAGPGAAACRSSGCGRTRGAARAPRAPRPSRAASMASNRLAALSSSDPDGTDRSCEPGAGRSVGWLHRSGEPTGC